MGKRKNVIERRPAELGAGLILAGSVYGFMAERGVPNGWAAVIAIGVAFVPGVISMVVDTWRQTGPMRFQDDEPHATEEQGPDKRKEQTEPPTG